MWVFRQMQEAKQGHTTAMTFWSIGFYDPHCTWHEAYRVFSRVNATAEVHYLNGGSSRGES